MSYFAKVFGFEETSYEETRTLLGRMASYSTVFETDLWLHRPITAEDELEARSNPASFTPLGDACGGADAGLKRSLSTTIDDPSEQQRQLVGERCMFEVPTRLDKDGNEVTLEQPIVWDAGIFSTPSVAELRDRVVRLTSSLTPFETQELMRVSKNTYALAHNESDSAAPLLLMDHVIGDSRSLHSEPENINSVMQAASQFNYLEFPSPTTTPEKGITNYVFDRTQGPACATACAPGTAYRNYLAMNRHATRGQTKDCQLNGLEDILADLTSSGGALQPFIVRNGYVESTPERLAALNAVLTPERIEQLVLKLRVGVHEDTQVSDEMAGMTRVKVTGADGRVRWVAQPTPGQFPARVTQVYCSALSIGYSRVPTQYWEPLAQLVLNATYEATYYVAVIHTIKLLRQGKLASPTATLPRTLLTKVGGGVFQNDASWIMHAMERGALTCGVYGVPLNVRIVHYGGVEGQYVNFPKLVMTNLAAKLGVRSIL